MKVKVLQSIFILLICLNFCSSVFSQGKPAALKFDEFDDSPNEYLWNEPLSMSQRIDRLARELKKQPQARVFIIYYQPRITESTYNEGESLASDIQSLLSYKKGINDERVILIDGGIRETKTIEFWIGSKNAEPPTPSPHFDKSELIVCPEIHVYGNGFTYSGNKTVGFSVAAPNNTQMEYEWNVSTGTIIAGQGTKEITVDVSNSKAKNVMAVVKAKGINPLCPGSGWSTLEINNGAVQIDHEVNYNESQMKARLDGFLVALNDNPPATGYIIIYASRTAKVTFHRSIFMVNVIESGF